MSSSDGQIQRLTGLLSPEVQPHAQAVLAIVRDFCEEQAFSAEQVEIALALLAEVMEKDMEEMSSNGANNGGSSSAVIGRPISSSIAHFQFILTKHAVERPPRSRGTFLPSEAVALYDLVVRLYYRKYGLYQYLCAGGAMAGSSANENYSWQPPPPSPPSQPQPEQQEAAAAAPAPASVQAETPAAISEKPSVVSVAGGGSVKGGKK